MIVRKNWGKDQQDSFFTISFGTSFAMLKQNKLKHAKMTTNWEKDFLMFFLKRYLLSGKN